MNLWRKIVPDSDKSISKTELGMRLVCLRIKNGDRVTESE